MPAHRRARRLRRSGVWGSAVLLGALAVVGGLTAAGADDDTGPIAGPTPSGQVPGPDGQDPSTSPTRPGQDPSGTTEAETAPAPAAPSKSPRPPASVTARSEGREAGPLVVEEHLGILAQVQANAAAHRDGRQSPETAALEESATGSALDAALGAVAELNDNGWVRSGEPRVLSSEVVESARSEDPPRVVVEACIDSSSVRVEDATGAPLPDPDARRPTTNIFTLLFVDGRWRVSDLTFPDDPDC